MAEHGRIPGALHATHDPELIAALAANDISAADRDRARALVAACPDCAILDADLLAIASAVRALPAPPAVAGRDFRLTSEAAARLDRGRGLRSLLRPFGGTSFAFARPLGSVLATFGLVGVLASASLPSLLGGAAQMTDQDRNATVPSIAPPEAQESPAAAMYASAGPTEKLDQASGAPVSDDRANDVDAAWLPVGSALLLSLGVSLLAARWLGRKVAGP